jgi:hypothetical protein
MIDDPDAPPGTYVHRVVVGLDPASTELAEGAVPSGAGQVRNSAVTAAYTGPCPPAGPPHHYRFTIYALQGHPEVGSAFSPEATIQAIGPPPPPAVVWSPRSCDLTNSAPMRSGLVKALVRGFLVTASSAGPTLERRSSTSGTSR